MPDANYEACGCSVPGCDLMVCTVCKVSDCKWPGKCKGKCAECGEPNTNVDGSPPSSTCSTKCTDIMWARFEADGTAVKLSDLTPEQINAEFKKIGLALDGVGERKPS